MFCVLILTAVVSSALFAVSTIVYINKVNKITIRIQKILSLIVFSLSISVLIISIIFTVQSSINIVDTETTTHTLSMQISTGIYLFLIFEISGLFSSNIANKIPEENKNE